MPHPACRPLRTLLAVLSVSAFGPSGARADCSPIPGIDCQCVECGPFTPGIGFRHDRLLQSSPGEAIEPAIDVSRHPSGDFIAVTWAESGPLVGMHELWLAVSTDAGCSWNRRSVLQSALLDLRHPQVAYQAPDRLAIVYLGADEVFAIHSEDGGATWSPPVLLSSGLAGGANAPQVAAVDGVGFPFHLHATWEVVTGGRTHVAYKRNLADNSPVGWQGSGGGPDETLLTAGLVDGESWSSAVAADVYSGSPGVESGVTVAFVHDGSIARGSNAFGLRSIDSGASFFGEISDPLTRDVPLRINQDILALDPQVRSVALDASGAWTDAGTDVNWAGVLWRDDSFSFADIFASAQAQAGPATPFPWSFVETFVRDGPATSRAPVLCERPRPDVDTRRGTWTGFWLDDEDGPDEVWVAGGSHFFGAAANTSLDCVPERLTGLFPFPRTAGAADAVAADEGTDDVYLTWVDTRAGRPEIWFKRSDSRVSAAENLTLTSDNCPGALQRVTVTWDPVTDCDLVAYILQWDTDPAFSAPGSAIMGPVADPTLDVPALGGVQLFVRVQAIDEACNFATSAVASIVTCTEMGLCDNGLDDDQDGLSDCDDTDCAGDPACAVACADPPEVDAASVRVGRAGDDVVVSFDDTAVPDQAEHFNAYRGELRAPFDGHDRVAGGCGLAASALIDTGAADDGGSHYYLVTTGCSRPAGPDDEGSLGRTSVGAERAAAVSVCP